MQATATMTTSKHCKLFRLAAAMGLLATLLMIAYVSWNSGSESKAIQRPVAAELARAAAEARRLRFQAINELPEAAVAAWPTVDYYFLDMNLMPETSTADTTLSGQALIRFSEWNLLMPGSEAAPYPAVDRDGQPD